jgi:hypothetical protein
MKKNLKKLTNPVEFGLEPKKIIRNIYKGVEISEKLQLKAFNID